MYAVIRTGGKQYRVEAGQQLRVEKLSGAAGDRVEFPEVLMIGGDGDVAVGTPTVENAKVVGEIVEQGRGRKITVFKYKSKTRYRRLRGHRQQQTLLAITEIQSPDGRSASYELRRPGALTAQLDDAPADLREDDPEESSAEATPVAEEPAAPEVVEAESAEAAPSDEAAPSGEAAPSDEPGPSDEAAAVEEAADVAPEPESTDDAPEAVAEPAAQARKTTAKKAAAKKTAAKKTAAKKTAAKKTAAKKTAAKKTTAKKTAAKKAAAKKAPAAKAEEE